MTCRRSTCRCTFSCYRWTVQVHVIILFFEHWSLQSSWGMAGGCYVVWALPNLSHTACTCVPNGNEVRPTRQMQFYNRHCESQRRPTKEANKKPNLFIHKSNMQQGLRQKRVQWTRPRFKVCAISVKPMALAQLHVGLHSQADGTLRSFSKVRPTRTCVKK